LIVLKETTDSDYIKSVFKHDSIWEWISDDSCSKESFEPLIHESIAYLIPELDGVPTGVLMLVKCNAVTMELHTAILPEYRGKCVGETFERLKAWASNLGYSRIRTWVCDSNKPAMIASKRVGFEYVGTEQKAFLKDEKLHDLHLYGITLCQQQYQL